MWASVGAGTNQEAPMAQIAQKAQTATEHKTVRSAIAAVIADIGEVQKTGLNSFHKYTYAKDSDIMRACRGPMAKHGVVVMLKDIDERTVTVKQGERNREATFVFAKFIWEVGHSGSEQTLLVPIWAGGQDSGEKADYKALTGAKKYAYLSIFALASSDDPENEGNHGGGNQVDLEAERKRIITDLQTEATKRERYIEKISVLMTTRECQTLEAFTKSKLAHLTHANTAQLAAYGKYLGECPSHGQLQAWSGKLEDMVIRPNEEKTALKGNFKKETVNELTYKELEQALKAVEADSSYFK